MALSSAPVMAKVKITVWHSFPAGAATDTFVQFTQEFQRQRPDIEVELVNAGGYGTALQKAQVALAGGAPPNVILLEQTRNMVFVDANAFIRLDTFATGRNGIDWNDFYPGMLETVRYDGKIFGVPYNTSTPLLYYNKDLFLASGLSTEAPKTWAQLVEAATKITRDVDGDGNPDVWGIDFYEWGWLFEAWIGQNGARVLSPDGKQFTFNSPKAVEAMQFIQDLVHKRRIALYTTSGYNLFWANKLGMAERSTASLANNIQTATFDMGVAPLACNVECYAPIGGGNFFLFDTGTAAEKAAAFEYLKFISATEQLARFAVQTGYMAARLSSFRSPISQAYFAKEPRARITYAQMDYARPRPKVPFWSEIDKELGKIGTVMYKENGNVKNALDEAVRRGNALLNEYLARKK